MKQEFIRVGRIVNAHGIRGEVRVQPRRVSPALLTRCKTFYIDGQPITPTANHVHKELVLLKLPGVDDMNAALTYKNKDLFLRRADIVLPEGEYFDDELLGLKVYDCDTGALLGTLTAVDEYPASKVYTVKGEREILIPAVKDAFIRTHQIRAYTTNKQMQVDDYPYGGGRGAVMQADPLFRCWEHVVNTYGPGRTIFMSPCGRTFTQSVARELKAQYDHLILVCGHYEGIDQRFIDACVDEELSMGDFVLTGGEIPAMAVPEILLSGDHAKVAAWRKKESYKRTMTRRPDLFANFDETKLTTKAERKILAQAKEEFAAEQAETSTEPEE